MSLHRDEQREALAGILERMERIARSLEAIAEKLRGARPGFATPQPPLHPPTSRYCEASAHCARDGTALGTTCLYPTSPLCRRKAPGTGGQSQTVVTLDCGADPACTVSVGGKPDCRAFNHPLCALQRFEALHASLYPDATLKRPFMDTMRDLLRADPATPDMPRREV